ncbi:MAG: glycosyltransferase family 4 protein [Betaproteobacteria bacterium]|nr:glycosyltransferase family 4 protein [Betaproteobacteria bacterium]
MTMSLLPPARHEVLVSLGRSAPGDGGIFEFSSQLARRIAQAAPAWRETLGVGFTFHLRPELQGLFGETVGYLPLHALQRLVHLTPRPFALWHSTHQMNKYRPPAGCTRQLVTIHDLNYLYGRPHFSVWRHNRRLRSLLRNTDHVATVSQHSAGDVQRHLGWTGPLEVIYNGACSFVEAMRRPLPGWDEYPRAPFLFHLSRMSPSKNPQAIIGLARLWPEMTFVLCGPPSDDAKKLRDTVKLPNLQFHLGIDDAQKAWAYAHCTGFLFPSLTEGFGMPPIEAMHFGKPVFLARRTCLPEIGGDAADYFDDFDPAAMKQVVERGLARYQAPGRADAIRAHAAQFDWDRAAAAYLALYRRLLGLPPG